MLTRQHQLGGQIAPGITLFPLFYTVITISDTSNEANLSEEKRRKSKKLINHTFIAILATSVVIKHRLITCPLLK